MKVFLLGALLLASTEISAREPEPNPYASPKIAIDAMVRAAEFGEPAADQRIERWLKSHPRADRAVRLRLYHRLCNDYGALSRNRARATACGREKQLEAGAEDADMAAALADQPPLSATGSASVPLIANKLGSLSAVVTANQVTAEWFIDTGAEVSVISQSLATKIGVRLLPGKMQVGTTTAPVNGALGMIDRLTIGGVTIEHLPILVLPDAQLTIGSSPTIPAILGLPAMVAVGRIGWVDGGRTLLLGDAAPAVPNGERIYWHEEGIGIPIATSRGKLGAFFDSGADKSSLRAPGRALLDAAAEENAVEKRSGLGGAGGIVEVVRRHYRGIKLRVGDAPVIFADMAMNDQNRDGAAWIGSDLIAQLSMLVLDFRSMRMRATPLAK